MSSSATSRKRKRDASPESSDVRVTVSSNSTARPMLASFPAIKPPDKTPFKLYSRDNDTILAGETEAAEFTTNEEETRRASSSGCHYLLAIHKPSTGTLNILPTSMTPHIISPPVVKALKSSKSNSGPSPSEYAQARTALGQAFGSKKAQATIRQRERNKVDVKAMEGVIEYLAEGIDKNSGGLLTKEEASKAADDARLIPPHDAEATNPEDVYKIHDIIPLAEWKAIKTKTSDSDYATLLPYHKSEWINGHMKLLDNQTNNKKRKDTLRMLIYAGTLMHFRNVVTKYNAKFTREQLQDKMQRSPSITLDSLMSRFLEKGRDVSSEYQLTTTGHTLLQTYLFALCLHIDSFYANTALLEKDLSLSKDSVNRLFKALGCTIATLTERDRTRLGLPESAIGTKRAVLKTPVKFPQARAKRNANNKR